MTEVLAEAALWVRSLVFRGTRHRCPVCGSRVRAFAGPGGSFRVRDTGYCPRCNGKSRHRFAFLMLGWRLGSPGSRWLLVSPAYCERRALGASPGGTVVAREPESGTDVKADIECLPFEDGQFDTVIVLHVLEHVDDDRHALGELYRVVRPGGVAIIGVPHDGRDLTDEDSSVVAPEERRERFGERDHRRAYGFDVVERVAAVGFDVEMWHSRDLDRATAETAGIRPDEALLMARKAG